MPKKTKNIVAAIVVILSYGTSLFAQAPKPDYKNTQVQPDNLSRQGSSEYYSTIPDAKLLVPVNVWGEVSKPGLHFVPINSSLLHLLSSAGGPNATASLPDVQIIRGKTTKYVDLFKRGDVEIVNSNDTVFVKRSLKSDLPLIFSGIGTTLSLATFILVYRQRLNN